MQGDKPKKSGLKFRLIVLVIVFGAGVYVGVEYADEIKSVGDFVLKPAPDAPEKPFSVRIVRAKTKDGDVQVWLQGLVEGKAKQVRVGKDLHTIRQSDRAIDAAKSIFQKGAEALNEKLKK